MKELDDFLISVIVPLVKDEDRAILDTPIQLSEVLDAIKCLKL